MAEVPFEVVDYSRVAAQVRVLNSRALTPAQYDDVVTLLEWMQKSLVQQDDALTARTRAVEQLEAELNRREKELNLRARVVNAAAGIRKPPRSLLGRYLRG